MQHVHTRIYMHTIKHLFNYILFFKNFILCMLNIFSPLSQLHIPYPPTLALILSHITLRYLFSSYSFNIELSLCCLGSVGSRVCTGMQELHYRELIVLLPVHSTIKFIQMHIKDKEMIITFKHKQLLAPETRIRLTGNFSIH